VLARAGSVFAFYVWVYVVFCFLVFVSQYQCSQLPGKTRLLKDIVSSGTSNPTHSLTVKPFNVAAVKVGDLACKIILAPFILAN